jgi:hypothetical protein
MISLSARTIQMCWDATSETPMLGQYDNERMLLESSRCSAGSTDHVHRCVQSEWGDENNVDHEELKREIDSHIEELIPQAMAIGLQIIQEYYDARIRRQNKRSSCIVI